ncbi:MAG: hypothetical protein K8W52_45230 [Deltaproteobacteria bacterium]|nr:hypothetical protein [Deltaproteobacteria bacterium]
MVFRPTSLRALAGCSLLAAACGGSSPDTADAAGGTVDAAPDGFTELLGRDWALNPGDTDIYKCVRITVPQDMYIQAFKAVAPLGTHHTVVTISTDGADGDYDCNAGSLDSQMLFATGVGTDTLSFPDGVAVKVLAGQHINLNLHLFDATDNPLSGHTAIMVKTIPAAQVQQQAEMVFAGTFNINIPSDNLEHTAHGGCTLNHDATISVLWPHMHQTAVHQKVMLTPVGGAAKPILDDDYSFTEQRNYPQAVPIQVHSGDQIDVTCSYINNTGSPKTFGESSTSEMCFTGIYRYPASASNLFECVTQF